MKYPVAKAKIEMTVEGYVAKVFKKIWKEVN